MYQVSSKWAVDKGYGRIHAVQLLQGGAVQATLAGFGGPSSGGGLDHFDLTVDTTATVWRYCDCVLFDPTGYLIPRLSTSVTAPFGNELRVLTGLNYPDGSTELIPLITGRIEVDDTTDDVEGGAGLSTKVTIYDRTSRLDLEGFDQAYVVPSGSSAVNTVKTIVSTVFSQPSFTVNITDFTVPATTFQEGDSPLASCQTILAAGGAVLHNDRMGNWVIDPIPDPYNNPGAPAPYKGFIEGPTSCFTKMEPKADAQQAHNKVIVIGQVSGSSPARADAVDSNSSSPTYYGGPFGKRPLVYKTSITVDPTQLQTMANAYLAQQLGVAQQIQVDSISSPALDPWDYVTVTRAALGLNGALCLIDSFSLSSDPATSMQTVVRKRF